MTPTPEERGFCDVVEVQEIGDTNIVVFRRGKHTLTHTKYSLRGGVLVEQNLQVCPPEMHMFFSSVIYIVTYLPIMYQRIWQFYS